jgi:hypothetical protein
MNSEIFTAAACTLDNFGPNETCRMAATGITVSVTASSHRQRVNNDHAYAKTA